MKLIFYDDAPARDFEPFALTRPVSELRAGTELLRRRWELALGTSTSSIVTAEHLMDFEEPGGGGVHRGDLPAGSILVNSRCAVSLAPVTGEARVWRCGGRAAAVRLSDTLPRTTLEALPSLDDLAPRDGGADVDGWWIDDVWDLVRHLPAMLLADIPLRCRALEAAAPLPHPPAQVGSHPVHLERGASVDPFVVFDTTAGPILVRQGANIQAFSRIVGPCYVGERTTIKRGLIANSAIGEDCRVHGEVSTSIFVGHDNKGHDGFIGHSVLGRWVNLGAATVNSNLKNTYGEVSLWTPRGVRETGMQFLGAMFGDHVRTAIGTRLTTGCVIGAGANVFGSETAPKMVPPFAWGTNTGETFALDGFLRSAERMMSRRQVALGDRARRQLAAAYARRWRTDR